MQKKKKHRDSLLSRFPHEERRRNAMFLITQIIFSHS